MALEAPVTYWERKRKLHQEWMKRMYIAFAVAIVVFGGSGAYFWGDFLATVHAAVNPDARSNLTVAELGLLVILISIVIALVRIPLKLATSQLHLMNDAAERVVMVKTYLAMLKGQHANPDRAEHVFTRLFAPAADGIVKDEFGPVTFIDWIKSAGQRQ